MGDSSQTMSGEKEWKERSCPNWNKKTQTQAEGYQANDIAHRAKLRGRGSRKTAYRRCHLNLALNSTAKGSVFRPSALSQPSSRFWHFLVPPVG